MDQSNDVAPGNNNKTAILPRQDPNGAVGNNNEMRTPPTLVTGDEGNSNVSSSYSDLIMEIGSHTVTVKGNARIEAVESSLRTLDNGIFACTICRYMSQEKVNTIAHIGYIHKAQPGRKYKSDCLDSCRPWEQQTEHHDPQPSST